MNLAPCSIKDAQKFVGQHHRHNLPPRGGLFAAKVVEDDETIGVMIVGRPVARSLNDGYTAEVTRVCTTGAPNAPSMLYGAARRAAKALGYKRLFTYTLASETGASLKASGWVRDADLPERPSWDGGQRHRVQADLFGNDRRPAEAKVRWRIDL